MTRFDSIRFELSGRQAHGLHEATLATFYRIFGDVRPSGEIIDLLAADR
jgi:hypothetical protein